MTWRLIIFQMQSFIPRNFLTPQKINWGAAGVFVVKAKYKPSENNTLANTLHKVFQHCRHYKLNIYNYIHLCSEKEASLEFYQENKNIKRLNIAPHSEINDLNNLINLEPVV